MGESSLRRSGGRCRPPDPGQSRLGIDRGQVHVNCDPGYLPVVRLPRDFRLGLRHRPGLDGNLDGRDRQGRTKAGRIGRVRVRDDGHVTGTVKTDSTK